MNILLLQLKRIGDLILTTPAIRSLREQFPDARLSLVADASCQGIVEALDVDETWIFHRTGLGGHFGLIQNLRSFRADCCLDFTGTDRSTWLTFISGSKRRVTFERFRKKFLRNQIYTDFVDSSVRDRHTADHYTDLLQPLGIKRENVPLDLRIPQNLAAPSATPYAVIHAGTARPEKYWQPERWAQVIELLHTERGLVPVLTGSTDAEEQKHLAVIKAAVRCDVVDLSGKTNLVELAAVIRGARIFCGVDTAAMHLADAMLTPSVALFGPTNPFHWRPRHAEAVVLRPRTPQPFSPSQKGAPMSEIEAEMVTTAIRTLLA